MIKVLQIITLFFLFISCSDIKERINYNELKRQLTPDRKSFIYEYSRFGQMAFSSDIEGIQIMSIKDTFQEKFGYLVPGYIGEWISNDSLLIYVYNFDHKQIDSIKGANYETYNGISIKLVTNNSNTAGRGLYTFDSVKIFENKMYLYNVDGNSKTNMVFPLGPITLYESADTIQSIHITKNDTINNLISTTTYEFAATKKMYSKTLGIIGIFRDFK